MGVGTVVKLRVPCLGNSVGTLGVGFNDYGDGCQFIFENGEYDGFSIEEQEDFLHKITTDPSLVNYQFQNVMKVSDDFRKGVFNSTLKEYING